MADTGLIPPPTVTGQADPRRSRRRWPWFLMGVILGILGMVGGIQVRHLATYSPLTFGNSWSFGGTTVGEVDGREAVHLKYQHGEPYNFRFNVSNEGGLTVKIMAFGPLTAYLLENVDLRMGPPPDEHGTHISPFDSQLVPFAPFSLKSGEQRAIQVRTRFGSCELGGGGTSFSSIPVSFSVLGFDRVQAIPLAEVSIVSPHPLQDAAYKPPAPRPGCPVLLAKGDEFREGIGATVTGSGNLRVSVTTQPRYEIWLRSDVDDDVRGCPLLVNEKSGGGFNARVDRIPGEMAGPLYGRKPVAVPATLFTNGAGTSWDPKTQELRTLRIECTENHHQAFDAEPSDLLVFKD